MLEEENTRNLVLISSSNFSFFFLVVATIGSTFALKAGAILSLWIPKLELLPVNAGRGKNQMTFCCFFCVVAIAGSTFALKARAILSLWIPKLKLLPVNAGQGENTKKQSRPVSATKMYYFLPQTSSSNKFGGRG